MKRIVTVLLLGMLFACTKEWRTSEPVVPSTYTAPSYRSATSIGRLGRLAVMQVIMHIEADAAEQKPPEWATQRDQRARELQVAVSNYLSDKKGYAVETVEASAPDEDAMQAAGRRLNADGIVVVERWIWKPWSTTKAIMNIFLLNVPLFQSMSAMNLRVSIYETTSGRLVWRQELKGTEMEGVESLDLAHVFGDLENAVPARLRR